MDKLADYRNIIKQTLTSYATLLDAQPTAGVDTELIFDETHDQYLLLSVGWSGRQRVRGTTVYIRLKNDKVWVEEDWLEEGIVKDLMAAGIPQADIILGFHYPDMRSLTEFAVS
jgi:hypothetical protein